MDDEDDSEDDDDGNEDDDDNNDDNEDDGDYCIFQVDDVVHWQTNKAGFHHSHKHGFGLLDAWRLVNAAKVAITPYNNMYSNNWIHKNSSRLPS